MILDASEPLYGRATEILNIRPLDAFWLKDALKLEDIPAVETYSIFGGIPRYWELALQFNSLKDALCTLIFDRDGVLHNEPSRLLLDNLSNISMANSLLSIVANGNHRLSKVASAIGKPLSSLSRPLANLIELGFLKREVPFGESTKSTKLTLYKLNDPFLIFWYKYVECNRSILEQDLIEPVYNAFIRDFPRHTAEIWESMAGDSVPFLHLHDIQWKPAQRWWGKGLDGKEMEMEIDIVSESFDEKHLLMGEVKWETAPNIIEVMNQLKYRAENFPKPKGRTIHFAIWLKQKPQEHINPSFPILLPEHVLTKPA